MNVVLVVLIVALVLFIILRKASLALRSRAKGQAEKREAERLEIEHTVQFIEKHMDQILEANMKAESLLDRRTGYFAEFSLKDWKRKYDALAKDVSKRAVSLRWLPDELRNTVSQFQDWSNKLSSLRKTFNESFVKEELVKYSAFFDSIEGRSLDQQQREAIIKDEDSNLVIAGAGSGKTTTIIGKVQYVMGRYHVTPDNILLISFTNKSAYTLSSRIGNNKVEAKTFHKFGKDVIALVEGKQPSVYDQQQFRPFIKREFEKLSANARYLSKLTSFFTQYMKEPKTQFHFDNQGEYIQYLKDQNFRTYKKLSFGFDGRVTYRQEIVKSVEECCIANFLLFNRVEYKYEQQYEINTATLEKSPYKPDFSIYSEGRRIYLEHFAVAKNGDVPRFFAGPSISYEQAKAKYWEKIEWARNLHKTHQTVLLESYSYEMAEQKLEKELKRKLEEAGVKLMPMTDQERWELIKDSAIEEVDDITALFQTFIILMKSNNVDIAALRLRIKKLPKGFEQERNETFLELVGPLYEHYQQHLQAKGEIDFSDMINLAGNYIMERKFNGVFRYVIIDEFQDLSIGRYKLLEAIKSVNPACKFFCVGDDWQSIYRFAGSDIALFREFERYFGTTEKSKIETTYRYCEPLISVSGNFIMRNPSQSPKKLIAAGTTSTSCSIKYSVSNNHNDTIALSSIFDELVNEGSTQKEIMVLGRYGFDINRVVDTDKLRIIVRERSGYDGALLRERKFNPEKWSQIKENEQIIIQYTTTVERQSMIIEAEFMTVHRAKGLEADIVIIINCNSGKHGFPSGMSDDRVLNLLLSDADQFENGEERRLFYVAMTRAKSKVFFVSDAGYKSKFISELEVSSDNSQIEKCPRCKTADVLLRKEGIARNGNKYRFYGCSNFLYGCNFTESRFENS